MTRSSTTPSFNYKRPAIFLGALSALLLASIVCLLFAYAPMKLLLAFASDQVDIFNEMRERALTSNASEAVECFEYVVAYYSSGTKQVAGSDLNRMVESARAQSIREIVAYLRAKTGEDLGGDPGPWIQRYGGH